MSIINITIILILSFVHAISNACQPIYTGRNYTLDQLVENTEVIAVVKVSEVKKSKTSNFVNGKFFDYKMKVVVPLKGKALNKAILLEEYESPDTEREEMGPGLDCFNRGGFKKGIEYLIFKGSVSSKGYKKISGNDDPWLVKVRNIIEEKNKEKKK